MFDLRGWILFESSRSVGRRLNNVSLLLLPRTEGKSGFWSLFPHKVSEKLFESNCEHQNIDRRGQGESIYRQMSSYCSSN